MKNYTVITLVLLIGLIYSIGAIETIYAGVATNAEFSMISSSDNENSGANFPEVLRSNATNGNSGNITIADAGTGTATAGIDYTFTPLTIFIPQENINDSIPITTLSIIEDTDVEPNETIDLIIIYDSGIGVGDINMDDYKADTHTYTITNDDFNIPTSGQVCSYATTNGSYKILDQYEINSSGYTRITSGDPSYVVGTPGDDVRLERDIENISPGNYDATVTINGSSTFDVEILAYNGDVWNSIRYDKHDESHPLTESCVEIIPPTSTSTTIRRPSHRTRNVQPNQPASATCPYFTEYSTQNNSASASEVMKIQEFLNTTINAGLAVDGIHGTMTTQAIKSYQAANMDIITKWEGNILAPTGNWMYSTRNHGNEAMGCDEGNVTLGNTGIVIN